MKKGVGGGGGGVGERFNRDSLRLTDVHCSQLFVSAQLAPSMGIFVPLSWF